MAGRVFPPGVLLNKAYGIEREGGLTAVSFNNRVSSNVYSLDLLRKSPTRNVLFCCLVLEPRLAPKKYSRVRPRNRPVTSDDRANCLSSTGSDGPSNY